MTKVLLGNIQGPPGGEGPVGLPQRQDVVVTTGSLAAGARYSGTVEMATAYRLIAMQTTGASRVRLYITTANRDADATRAPGTDPAAAVEHGVVADMVFDSSTPDGDPWYLSPMADSVLPSGTAVPILIDNMGSTTAVITVTLTFIRTE